MKQDVKHRAREAALQILYLWDVGQSHVALAAETVLGEQWPEGESPSEELRVFATGLASETVRRLEEVDQLIAETAERWRPERMAIIDRLILRMGACELLHQPAPPPAVVINECLELARTFSTEDSVKFINGMLDGLRKKLSPEQ